MSGLRRFHDHLLGVGFQLRKPDGRALYGYRLREARLDRLGKLLEEEALPWLGTDRFGRFEAAMLCLYAAERFSRCYAQGPWRWDIALDGLEFRGAPLELRPDQRAWVVREGLRYWRRSVLQLPNGDNQFLVSLICEGGVPRKLLSRPDSAFATYLRELLSQRERAEAIDTETLAEDCGHRLPYSLRRPQVYRMAAELVDAVARIRAALPPTAAEAPLAWLDAHRPDWRAKMPLRIDDDDNAQLLLLGLVRQPIEASPAREPLRVRAHLELEPTARVGWGVEIDPTTERSSLARQLGVEELPEFGSLHLATGEHRALVARWEPAGTTRTRIRALASTVGTAALDEVPSWVATVEGEVVAEVECNAEPLGELAWVFGRSDDPSARSWLLGQGAMNLRDPEAWVLAVPEDLPESSDAIVERRPVGDRILALVRGHCVLGTGIDAYTVQTGAAQDEVFTCRLERSHALVGVDGLRVYLGKPRAFLQRDDVRRPIDPRFVSLKPRHGGDTPWQHVDAHWGEVTVRVQDHDGSRRLQRRAVVLPPDFEVRRRRDRLELRSAHLLRADVDGPGWCAEATRGGFDLRVEPGAEAARVRVELDGRGVAWLPVTPPGRIASFVDSAGRPLPNGADIHFRKMANLRVQVFERPYQALSLMIVAPNGLRLHRPLPREAGGQLFLDAVEPIVHACLGSGVRMEDAVELRIDGIRDARIRVRRFEVALCPDQPQGPEGRTLGVVSEPPSDLQAALEARPIDDWGAEPIEVPLEAQNRWRVARDALPEGSVLLTAPPPHRSRFRPLACFTGRNPAVPKDRLQAIATEDLTAPERVKKLADLWRALLSEPEAPELERLRTMVASLEELPANTFHAVVALAEVPEAAVWVLLSSSARRFDEVWEGLERLRFTWWSIPLEAWSRGAEALRSSLVAKLGDDPMGRELVAERMASSLDRVQDRMPALRPVRKRLTDAGRLPLPPRAPDEPDYRPWTLTAALDAEAQQLIARRAAGGPRWPQFQEGCAALTPRQAVMPSTERWRRAVLDAPLWVAETLAAGRKVPLHRLLELRLLRAFDVAWFDQALALRLALAPTKETP